MPAASLEKSKPKVLLIWEMGNDLGHLMRLTPLADQLAKSGLSVSLVPKEKAPKTSRNKSHLLPKPATFADVLLDHVNGDARVLELLVNQWRDLFDATSPDIVILDHSPFAFLALQGLSVKTVVVGTGFSCPAPLSPLPDLRPWENNYPDRLLMNELLMLDLLNGQLEKQQQEPLDFVGQLYQHADQQILATFKELDHYKSRKGGMYCGIWTQNSGATVCWPGVPGKKIFAYLKPFAALPDLLGKLYALGLPVLVYLRGVDEALKERYRSNTLRFVKEPLDIDEVKKETDLAILNAGHGTTAEMLLAGVPMLQIPILVEQYHTAMNVEQCGAGLHAPANDAATILSALEQLLSNDEFRNAAQLIADRYADFNKQQVLRSVVSDIAKLVK